MRVNVMLDTETLGLLDKIGGHIGSSNRSAVIRYLAREWARANREESKAMRNYDGYGVTVRYFEDSLFGSQDPAAEGYDAKASAERYGELVTAAIEEAYPGIEVTLEYGPYAANPVTVYGAVLELEEQIRLGVEEITGSIYERGEWAVELADHQRREPSQN